MRTFRRGSRRFSWTLLCSLCCATFVSLTETMATESSHSRVKEMYVENCNGLTVHCWSAGDPKNPLILLLHGFPETAFSWHDYLEPLADTGYYAVAPDLRGYGYTSPIPELTENGEFYSPRYFVTDAVALTYRLGHESCSVVGHDWGASVAMRCATRRPDMFTSVCLISVPFLMPRLPTDDASVAEWLRSRTPEGHTHYQSWFVRPSTAKEFTAHGETFLLGGYMAWGLPGAQHLKPPAPVMLPTSLIDEHGAEAWARQFPTSVQITKESLAPAFSDEYLEYNFKAFRHTGFGGPLQYYTASVNGPRTEDLQFANKRMEQPILFIAGERDPVIGPLMFKRQLDEMDRTCPGLTKQVLLKDASHWVHLERKAECIRLILDFESKVWE